MSDDLARLARDLDEEGKSVLAAVQAVVAKGALNVKRDWRQSASGLRHAQRYPYSIGYETSIGIRAGIISAEIGPDKSKTQGALGNLIEFGSAKNPPHNDGGKALQAEEPRFVEALGNVVGRRLAR